MKRLDNLIFNTIGFIHSEILEIRVYNDFYPISLLIDGSIYNGLNRKRWLFNVN